MKNYVHKNNFSDCHIHSIYIYIEYISNTMKKHHYIGPFLHFEGSPGTLLSIFEWDSGVPFRWVLDPTFLTLRGSRIPSSKVPKSRVPGSWSYFHTITIEQTADPKASVARKAEKAATIKNLTRIFDLIWKRALSSFWI